MAVRDSIDLMTAKKGPEVISMLRYSQIRKSPTILLMLTSKVEELKILTTVDLATLTKCYL
jgi:hypothetical protein